MNKRLAWTALLLAVVAAPAYPAVVYLKDGGQLEGTIVNKTPDYIEIKTGGATVRVDADKIQSIDYSAEAPAAQQAPAAPAPPPRYYGRRWFRQPPPSWQDLRNTINFDVGVAIPLSKVDLGIGGAPWTNGDAGALVGFQYLYSLDPNWAAGFDFNYFNRSGSHTQNQIGDTDVNVFGDNLVMLGLLKYSFREGSRARPYLAAGAGVARDWTAVDGTPDPGFVWSDTATGETRRLVDDVDWTWATALRAGVDFLTGPEVFSLEIGWTHFGQSTFAATPDGQNLGISGVTASLDALQLAARWGWRF